MLCYVIPPTYAALRAGAQAPPLFLSPEKKHSIRGTQADLLELEYHTIDAWAIESGAHRAVCTKLVADASRYQGLVGACSAGPPQETPCGHEDVRETQADLLEMEWPCEQHTGH